MRCDVVWRPRCCLGENTRVLCCDTSHSQNRCLFRHASALPSVRWFQGSRRGRLPSARTDGGTKMPNPTGVLVGSLLDHIRGLEGASWQNRTGLKSKSRGEEKGGGGQMLPEVGAPRAPPRLASGDAPPPGLWRRTRRMVRARQVGWRWLAVESPEARLGRVPGDTVSATNTCAVA